MLCHISEPLTEAELSMVSQGVSKLLANGKARILIEIEDQALQGMQSLGGLERIEKALAVQKELAQKLGGEIRIKALSKQGEAGAHADIPMIPAAEAAAAAAKAAGEIDRLKKEIATLHRQVEGLLARVSEPSTNQELKAAVDHYQALAEAREESKV
jgi:hypothetical protein